MSLPYFLYSSYDLQRVKSYFLHAFFSAGRICYSIQNWPLHVYVIIKSHCVQNENMKLRNVNKREDLMCRPLIYGSPIYLFAKYRRYGPHARLPHSRVYNLPWKHLYYSL